MPRFDNEDTHIVETWEITTPGTIWVTVYDRRDDRYTQTRVGGREGASKRLNISRDDRKFNQESIIEERKHLDPFTNGKLRFIKSSDGSEPEGVDRTYHMTDQDLLAMLADKNIDSFEQKVRAIQSELIVRRLVDIADKDGTRLQYETIRDIINERYPVGGTQRAVRDMVEAGEKLAGMTLS